MKTTARPPVDGMAVRHVLPEGMRLGAPSLINQLVFLFGPALKSALDARRSFDAEPITSSPVTAPALAPSDAPAAGPARSATPARARRPALGAPARASAGRGQLMRLSLGYWRRRFPSLEAVMADPLSSRLLFACAHGRLRAKLRGPKK